MKIAIIGNGLTCPFEKVINNYDLIIAADGGANHCRAKNITPDFIIGDLDSIKEKVNKFYSAVKQIKNIDQNKTDIEKCLEYINETIWNQHKIDEIDIFCVNSTDRLDHMLANIYLLNNYNDWPIKINCEKYTLEVVSKYKNIKNKINKTVSLFPLSKTIGLNLNGFKWNLSDDDVIKNKFSISNIIISDEAEIELELGEIILIINK